MHSGVRAPDADLDALFRAERGSLWGIAYRLTGTAADADDIVQEAFARALAAGLRSPSARCAQLAAPPEPVAGSLVPWLVRVVTNLALDTLRRRKGPRYERPWPAGPWEETGRQPARLAPPAGG